MPTPTSTKKRKQPSSGATSASKATKKSKSKPPVAEVPKDAVAKRSSENPVAVTQDSILVLEEAIIESPKNYNQIVTLIGYFNDPVTSPDLCITSAVALCRTFCRLMSKKRLSKKRTGSAEEVAVSTWLKERYNEYFASLCEALEREGPAVQNTALTLLMRFIKEEALYLKPSHEEAYFPHESFGKIVKAVLTGEKMEEDVKMEWAEKYITQYDDVRYSFFSAAGHILSESDSIPTSLLSQIVSLILSIGNLPTAKTDDFSTFYALPDDLEPPRKTPPILSLTAHRRTYQTTILSLLRLPLPDFSLKSILNSLSPTILPVFPQPHTLLDFLLSSYSHGGVLPLLSLSGIFELITKHNLDFPDFYPRLYALLDRHLLHTRYRSQFLRLLETFLSSTHLPAQLIASFIKRLSRLCLSAPPGAIVAIVPFIYNLFQAHKSTTYMMHREFVDEDDEADWDGKDPFDESEMDPMKTRAIESCVWELKSVMRHWHPNVATLARIVEEQFTKERWAVEDFLDHGFGSMFEAEIKKDIKKAPVVEWDIPKRIFSYPPVTAEGDGKRGAVAPVVEKDNVLLEVWDFA
ncbi:CBF-domain-containing protein [Ascodesmis nigricans]|uniref:CBF-domain-containing protein n=1 Tax=Ascodesmis nigricans TaxID=341454 RepID=A0A4V3SJS6_9PEZI|nr:CBF-domain-containing protein [Ascodesmis nigricans]